MTLQNLDITKELKNFGKLLNNKSDDFKFSWIRLARTKNVGSKTFVQLLKMYGDPETALQNVDTLAKKGGSPIEKLVPSKQAIEKEIAETKKYGAKIRLACEENYPSSLLHIPDFPPVLIVKGNIQLLKKPMFAIIGARNSSINW